MINCTDSPRCRRSFEMRLRCAVLGEGGCGIVGVGGLAIEARGSIASGDVWTLREREANRGGPGRTHGGDKCAFDSTTGVGGGRGVAGVTETEITSDSGRKGRGRMEVLRASCWCGTGGADLGAGGMGILGKGLIFWHPSASRTSMLMGGAVRVARRGRDALSRIASGSKKGKGCGKSRPSSNVLRRGCWTVDECERTEKDMKRRRGRRVTGASSPQRFCTF